MNNKWEMTYDKPAIMIVLEFPPRLSFSRNVNTESRYGTNSLRLNDSFFPVDTWLTITELSAGTCKCRLKFNILLVDFYTDLEFHPNLINCSLLQPSLTEKSKIIFLKHR